MKTQEEILQSEFDKENLGNTTQVQFCYDAIKRAMDEYAINILKQITTYNPNKNTYDSAIDILIFLEKQQ